MVAVAAKKDKTLHSGAVIPPMFVEANDIPLLECSALTGDGVEDLMQFVAQEAVHRINSGTLTLNNTTTQSNPTSISSTPNSTCSC